MNLPQHSDPEKNAVRKNFADLQERSMKSFWKNFAKTELKNIGYARILKEHFPTGVRGASMASGEYRWRGGFCLEVKPVPNTIVIFGASGDLACRKLIPALFHLWKRGLLHEKSRIVGCARTSMDDNAYHTLIRKWIGDSDGELEEFLSRLSYLHGDYGDPEFYRRLSGKLDEVEKEADADPAITGRIFYLSMPSALYETIVDHLGESGLTREDPSGVPWRHVILEKPFGRDLDSARELDNHLHRTLQEHQIYRIDHYLGKETVQNILVLRFANTIFEPVWNANYIDNIQITVAETVGVEHRAGYFDSAGLLRDMFQNHILEMLSLVAMEIPSSSAADSIRDEKLKLLKSIRPFERKTLAESIIRGQYTAGTVNGTPCPGYREEPGISPDSRTETFVAMRLFIDNWRWRGVPFYLRSGKRMPRKTSNIVINFKPVPHSIFSPLKAEDLTPNQLILNVQPQEGLALTIQAKQPGPKLCMGALSMDFKYASILEDGSGMPDAYERLLLDCMLGDQTLFIRNDTIEYAWSLLTPILREWEENTGNAGPIHPYAAGTWGPKAAEDLTARDNVFWRNETN